jgi:hypothetical protein
LSFLAIEKRIRTAVANEFQICLGEARELSDHGFDLAADDSIRRTTPTDPSPTSRRQGKEANGGDVAI